MSEFIEDNELEEYANENDDIVGVGELPGTQLEALMMIECLTAKFNNPEMFVSGFDADDGGIVDPEDPDSPGERLLTAAEEGNMTLAQELLDLSPVLVAYKDKDGYTPLHRAAYSDKPDIIRLLISKGAKVDEVTEDGWTALHSACHWNTFKSVRELVDNNANVNAKTNGGRLFYEDSRSVYYEGSLLHPNMSPVMLFKESRRGHTPLHIASNEQSREAMIVLLTCPYVDKSVTNCRGETAEVIARRAGRYGNLFDMDRESINKL